MKICFITTFYTGATLPLVQHLVEQGNQCDFYLFAEQGRKNIETLDFDSSVSGNEIVEVKKNNPIFQYLDKSISVSIVPYYIVKNRKYLIGYIPFFKNLLIIHRLLKEVEKNEYDLIYLIVNEENDGIIARELKRRKFKNVVIAYHEVVKSHTGKQELKEVVKLTSKLGYPLICYSKQTKEKLRQFINNDNIHVTYFGPFETYKRYDTSLPMVKEPYILFIGSIQPYKGLSFLYESIRDFGSDLSTKIVVAGSGYDSCLQEMTKDDRFIVINRFLDDIEFANLTRHASCIVCPYVSGSQSGITHTAMVFGTPVVATKVGAFPEFIKDTQNGYLVNYGEKESLIKAISTIINSTPQKRYMIPEHLQWKNIAEKLQMLVEKM